MAKPIGLAVTPVAGAGQGESPPDSSALRANLGDEIYEIFVEEVTEIHTNFQDWIPRWQQQRNNNELLRDIRRGFHTCKGSGRMAGALALGDYAWAHESMLNKVLEKTLPVNDRLASILGESVDYLGQRLPFFLTATKADVGVGVEVAKIDAFVANPDAMPVSEPAPAPVAQPEWVAFDSLDSLADVDAADSLDESVLLEVLPDPDAFIIPDTELIDFDSLPFVEPVSALADTAVETQTETDADADDTGVLVFDSPELFTTEPELVLDEADAVAEPVTDVVTDLSWLSLAGDDVVAEQPQPDAIVIPEPAVPQVVAPVSEPAPVPLPTARQTEPPAEAPAAPVVPFNELEESRIVWAMFREELPEQLQSLDRLMQALQANPADRETRQSLERELHTLKGGARMAQLMDMGDIAHQAESILEKLGRSANVREVESKISVLQGHVDQINALAEHYSLAGMPTAPVLPPEPVAPVAPAHTAEVFTRPPVEVAHDSLLERLLADQAQSLPDIGVLMPNKSAAPSTTHQLDDLSAALGQEQIRLPASFLDKMIERAGALNVQQNGLAERLQVMTDDVGEFGRTASRLKQLLRSLELETEAQIHAGYRQSGAVHGKEGDFDPLEMDQYSEIQRLSRALAESLNDLVNIEADLGLQLRNSHVALKDALGASRYLHQDLLETRLVEAMVIVPRLRRIVRQTSTELDRQAVLDVDGEAFKLDRHLLQRMTAPIEHLLRNAVSHGIEPPAERAKAGKPEQGQLILKVFREDTEIVFQVKDDGRGMDRTRLRNKALEQGLIRPQDTLSDQEALRLILRPGFSTATSVSQISGRGVGMDVVSSEVKALGGTLQIDSVLGEGSTFTVRLPFAMAVNPVLFVETQGQTYALPMGYIQGLSRLDAAKVKQYLAVADKRLEFNDAKYELQYLGGVLEPGAQLQVQPDHMYPVVFVRTSGHCIAWIVDVINGRREVVLQSLGSLFKGNRFYSAATITTDGDVVLLPDMADLAIRVQDVAPAAAPVGSPAQKEVRQVARARHERPHIMVVDDSITVRKVTEKLLASENLQVETAKDGLEALEKLEKFDPDLILMDIEMPRMDGFEVLETVRQNPEWNHVPIIMISSRTAEKHRQRAEQLGANGFLGKPYQNQELLELIRGYLGKNKQKMGAFA